jgi:WD40 repeat protein/predicted Ser/Thr protein kinase
MPPHQGEALRRIGPYHVERRIGAGGMGVVYLGRHRDSGAVVAVKVIKPEFAADERFRARLRREVAAARRVPRFCTAPVVGADLDAEPPYIATEYIDGPTLDVAVLERGPLREADLEGLATGIAVALRAIHGQGVIHRDLKPSNILLSSVGPRVIDFGIARLEDAQTQLTHVGGVVGTLAYMAPEQLRGGPITPAVDLFAWASLVTYAATGRPPFGTDSGVRQRILTGEPNLDGLDEPLRELVRAAFTKDRARRPSAADLVERLSRSKPAMATRVLETAATSPAPPSPPEAPDDAEPYDAEPYDAEPYDAEPYDAEPYDAEPYDAEFDDVRVDEAAPAIYQPHTVQPEGSSTTAAPPRRARRRRKLWTAALLVLVVGMVPAIVLLARGDDGRRQGFGTLLHTMTDHSSDVNAVAVGTLNGRTIAVSGGVDNTVRVWDVATGEQLGEPLKGHGDDVYAVALGERNHRLIAASASAGVGGRGFLGFTENDNAVRVWDVAARKEIYRLPHNEGYSSDGPTKVALGTVDGRPVAISASDQMLRVWSLTNGKPIGKPVTGLAPVDFGVVDGRPVMVAACPVDGSTTLDCRKESSFVWDIGTKKQIGKAFIGRSRAPDASAALGRLNGHTVVVADSRDDDALRVWDLNTGKPVGKPLIGHTGNVFCVAVGQLNGRAIAVSGGVDQTVRVWDLATGRQLGKPFRGHNDIVESVALGTLNGRPIVVSASDDDTVRVWDLGPPYP